MRALLQRVTYGKVSVDGNVIGQCGKGFVILFGAAKGDTPEDLAYLLRKTVNLRVFSDEQGKMNRSILDVGGEALVVSQFTLYADCRRGNRPGFDPAAEPAVANAYYEQFIQGLKDAGIPVQSGSFGADMQVELVNDGPVTILLESPLPEK